jgi:hypothetical protein
MPFTAAAAGTGGLTAGSALFGNIAFGSIIGGSIFQTLSQRQADKQAAAIADINAQNLLVKSKQEEQITQEEVGELEEEKKRQISRLRVLGGIAGIDAVGTPLLQVEEIAGQFEEEKKFTAQAGRVRRFDLRTQAGLESFRGKQIRRASPFRTGATLLTGIGTAGSLLL